MMTVKRLRKVLSYAPTPGTFRWKVSAGSRASLGAIAGAKNGRGYHQIRIGGRPYSASRLAWLYMTGKWPTSEISMSTVSHLTRDGQTFGKQHHRKIAVALRGIAKAFAGCRGQKIMSTLCPKADIGRSAEGHCRKRGTARQPITVASIRLALPTFRHAPSDHSQA